MPAGLLLVSAAATAQDVVYHDEEVKAAFIYHFATFVEWPTAMHDRPEFRVAVLGAADVAAELEKFLPGRTISDRPMRVVRLDALDDLDDVDVLFVGAEHNDQLPDLAPVIEARSILLVTESPDALDNGSMINFEIVDERVRFEIALGTARKAGLDLSSRLLAAAMSVNTTSALPRPSRRILVAQL